MKSGPRYSIGSSRRGQSGASPLAKASKKRTVIRKAAGVRDNRPTSRPKRSSRYCQACGQPKGKSSRRGDAVCKRCARGDWNDGYQDLPPTVATYALQGSPEKIDALAARAARGESLFRPDDGTVADLR
jgi:hypothetical protein